MNRRWLEIIKDDLMGHMDILSTPRERCDYVAKWFWKFVHEFHVDNVTTREALESLKGDTKKFDEYENRRLAAMVGEEMLKAGVLGYEELMPKRSSFGELLEDDWQWEERRQRASIWVLSEKLIR